jgi:hypothetical protein
MIRHLKQLHEKTVTHKEERDNRKAGLMSLLLKKEEKKER